VHIRRPPRRLQRHRRPEFLDRSVECVRDGVRIDHLVRQEILVKPLGHDRAIVIGHGPAGLLSAAAAGIRYAHSPHRCNDTLEARVHHRSCEMHDLVRLIRVALGRLARRQIREPRLVEVQVHQL
jgi:hypothetical protein